MTPNIQSLNYDQGALPFGFRAGELQGWDAVDKQQANAQGLQEQNLSNVIKEVEARRAQSDYSAPGMEAARQQGILGENRGKYADGQLKYDTLDSNTKTKLAENLSKASAAEIESTINGIDMFITAASSGQGGIGMQQALSNLPPQYQQIVQRMEQQKPGSSLEYAKQFKDVITAARADNAKYRADVSLKEVEGEQTAIVQGMRDDAADARSNADNASRQAIERMGIEAGKYKRGGAGTSITAIYAKMTPQARLGSVQRVLTTGINPETGEPLTDMERYGFEAMYNQDKRTVDASNASKVAGKIDIPNVAKLPEATPPSVGGGVPGTAQGAPAKKVWDPITKTWVVAK